jgi:RNA polymerase sigma-70 factor (ECF subfamily)
VDQRNAGSAPRTEEALARAASCGDVEAFETLYRMHVGRIHALCMRMSGSGERAARLTQDVFVRAWGNLEGFRGESSFGTWLYRIAVNENLMDRRSRRRRRRWEVPGEEAADTRSVPPAGVGIRMDLERAIAALPEGARQVFVLHEVEGFTHEEIAELAGIAPGTSKAQLHRAKKLLRRWLER